MPGGNREPSDAFNVRVPFRRGTQPLSGPVPFTGGSGITLPGVGSPFVAMGGAGLLEEGEPLGRGRQFTKGRVDRRDKAAYGT